MAHIPVEIARRVAIDRIITALRGQYATELAAVADTGLVLPAPPETGYFSNSPDDPEADNVLFNADPAVLVWPAGPRTMGDISSGGTITRAQVSTFEVDVLIMFRQALHAPLTTNGHELSEPEYMMLRAERYAGAMIKTLYRYAPEGNAIHDIELVADEALPLFLQDRPIMGIASARWRIIQKVAIPQRSPLP